ncbi:MAG: secondary thiamine-phosphate synthase enzyme YjbQ [Candidatus Omnitrophica bacterium]|nr:secondary thiamine-phosphate synthase enzyme YjbQ [Candidatus Omnitrophota bacterium]
MRYNAYGILQVASSREAQMIDVTADVSAFVRNSGISDGICHLFVPHTTAAVTINENADPDVVADMLMGLENIVRPGLPYRHAEGNSPAHIKSSLIGVSGSIFVNDGGLVLGTWQGIYFCEFDGPRRRSLSVKIVRTEHERA